MTLSAWELESPNYAPVHSILLSKIKAGNLVNKASHLIPIFDLARFLKNSNKEKLNLYIPQVIKVVS